MKKIALIYPGQGVDLVKSADVRRRSPAAGKIFEYSRNLINRELLTEAGQTPEIASQVHIVASSIACFESFVRDQQLLPAIHYMAGHSLGEYSALICAGVLEISEGLNLLMHRQRLMDICAESVDGKMAVIQNLSHTTIVREIDLLRRRGFSINVSAFNAPRQVAVSGQAEAIDQISKTTTKLGGISVPLTINGPLHSELMQEAKEEFKRYVNGIRLHKPKCIVFSSVTGKQITGEEEIKHNLVEQLTQPVLWQTVIDALVDKEVDVFVTLGLGRTLEKLISRNWPSCNSFNLAEEKHLITCRNYLHTKIGDFITPVTRCLANAISTQNYAENSTVTQIMNDYNKIWRIQLAIEEQQLPASTVYIGESLSFLTSILTNKGLSTKQISDRLDQLALETGLKCLHQEFDVQQ